MKQKPVFLKHLTYIVSMASLLFPAANLLHLNSIFVKNEGNHPKNVNLAGPDVITGALNKIYYVNSSCDSVDVYTKTPTSNCHLIPSFDSLSYTVDGGSPIILISGPTNTPDSVFIGRFPMNTFPIDTIRLIWYAREVPDLLCGQIATGLTQSIFIRDTLKPTPNCKNITVYLNNTGDTVLTASMFDNVSSDNCASGNQLKYSFSINTNDTTRIYTCDSVANSPRPVTLFVTDKSGNRASCSANITVRDTISPTITCPTNITVNANPGQTYASNVNLGVPMNTNDNCLPIKDTIITFNGNPFNASTQLPGGVNTILWTVTDKHNNTGTCTQTVTIDSPPTINCPPDTIVQCMSPAAITTFIAFRAAGGTAMDDIKLDSLSFGWVRDELIDSTCVNRKTIHRYYKISDISGNADTCFHVIAIRDTIAPIITCKDSVNLYLNSSGMVSVTASSLLKQPVSDNCSGIVSLTTVPPNLTFNCNDLITNKIVNVTITARDTCGNTNTNTSVCTSVISLRDTIKPTINCPSNITISTAAGKCDTLIRYTIPPASDNCGPITPFRISGNPDSTRFATGLHTITYRATDEVGNSDTCSFTITVRDMEDPTINCPANDSVALNDSCYMTVPDLRKNANDNCGIDTLVQSPTPGTVISSRHDSIHTFTFTVTDLGGRTVTCQTSVTARDSHGPNIVFDEDKIQNLGGKYITVSAKSFVDIVATADACGGNLIYKVRRMSSNTLQDSVTFTCDDVNDTIMIVINVCDQRGNCTPGMVRVKVLDSFTPVITTFLPDITISCEYPLNINNLSAFGTYDSIPKTIVINDPGNISSPTRTFQNGVYSENCPDAQVNATFVNQLNMCNTGEIKRAFSIRDAAGNITRDTQSIFVMDFNRFSMGDITWPPAQVDYYDCQRAVPDTAVTKSPRLRNDRCSQAAATFADQPFSNPAYCKAIIRTWTVIDWCQYKSNTLNSPGKWTFDQLIIIRDTIAPVINSACRNDSICTPFGDCSASVTYSATATDNCSASNAISWVYKIDLGNNGGNPDITANGSTFTRTFALGTHRLTWEAKDPCGNTSTCSFLFDIIDCKAPSLVVLNGLATSLMPVMNMIQVKAKSFDNLSSDNCTPTNQLRFSYSSNSNDTIRTFTCDSIGSRNVDIWLTDNAGNQTKTRTTIDIQDPHKTCPLNVLVNISGSVYTETGNFVPDIIVKIDGGETERTALTDKNGEYSFKNLAKLNDYEIIPEKNTGHLDGVTTLDLIIMQRHILGLKTLDSPFKLIAADVNNSKSITAGDLLELRKVVLGVENEFKNNTSWRFVDAGHKFGDINYPWIFRSNIQYSNLEQNMIKSNFIAVKTGDVNGSVMDKLNQQNTLRTSEKTIIKIEDVNLNAGEVVVVPVYSDLTEQLAGVQWTMELKPGLTYSGIESAAFEMNDENTGIIEIDGKQYITISSHQLNSLSTDTKKELFYLVFKATKNASLSSMLKFSGDVTPALAVTRSLEEKRLAFEFRTKVSEEAFITQNQPNPFRGETVVQLSLKKPSMTEISIFDAKGSAVYNGFENLSSGVQSLMIGEKQLGNQTGIFYCRIKNNEMNQVIKMLRIE